MVVTSVLLAEKTTKTESHFQQMAIELTKTLVVLGTHCKLLDVNLTTI